MSPAVEIRNVSFAYGERQAVREISLEIPQGERIAILGPNGSGKSTLLKLLSLTLQPAAGEILLQGKPIQSYARKALSQKVAVVPQETQTSFPYTVAEMVLMGRASFLPPFALERKRDLEVARECMALTETLPLADRYLHELSGGEKQRVILARALAQQAEILLLDEPTTFLDIKHQIQIHELVLELSRNRGLAVIAALHDLNLASLYFPRLALLQNGRIRHLGSPKEVLNEETIQEVYGVRVRVQLDGSGTKPQILPVKI
ncbi:MAG: heme ABC transporter ATP-binding protein [Candidatus Binatia bacterium]